MISVRGVKVTPEGVTNEQLQSSGKVTDHKILSSTSNRMYLKHDLAQEDILRHSAQLCARELMLYQQGSKPIGA